MQPIIRHKAVSFVQHLHIAAKRNRRKGEFSRRKRFITARLDDLMRRRLHDRLLTMLNIKRLTKKLKLELLKLKLFLGRLNVIVYQVILRGLKVILREQSKQNILMLLCI